MHPSFPIAIIGGGPVGLAAAANLALWGLPFTVFEAGEKVGTAVRSWGHIRMFSPWKYTMDRAAEQLLKNQGWKAPQGSLLPTGKELVEDFLEPLAALPGIQPHIKTSSRVLSVQRYGIDKVKSRGRTSFPFELSYIHAGSIEKAYASAVIDATGTWGNPNPAGSGGVPAPGEITNKNRIFYGIPDRSSGRRSQYWNKAVAVLGSGHSAINSLLELHALNGDAPRSQIFWIMRRALTPGLFGGGSKDDLPARATLGQKAQALVD